MAEILNTSRVLVFIGRTCNSGASQTTDCEIEVNGLLTYDRALVKMDQPAIAAAAKKLYTPPPKRGSR